jgi:DDE family transposase
LAHAPEQELTLNVVRVWEPKPPRGAPAVCWMLYTSEPIDTAEQLLTIVDQYRSRWVIEEFFKALKTGCAFEKRQLESYRAPLCTGDG